MGKFIKTISYSIFLMCFFASIPAQASGEKRQVMNDELTQLLRGNTIDGESSVKFHMFFRDDGKVFGLTNSGQRNSGDWKVKDDKLCVFWFNPNWEHGCDKVFTTDTGYVNIATGNETHYEYSILPGNPEELE